MQRFAIFIYGPTGVGKSDFAYNLAQRMPCEIVNMDVGQFYEPFTIGTAKPPWKDLPVSHHLFDIIQTPQDFTVTAYREQLISVFDGIWQRGNIPMVVGGSGFYLSSVLFPPAGNESSACSVSTQGSWGQLHAIDPHRAQSIHPNDGYRIARALELCDNPRGRSSDFAPRYNPPCPWVLLSVGRERSELYDRINKRTAAMFHDGFVEEVKSIMSSDWEQFIRRKKLIGYLEVLDYLCDNSTKKPLATVIERMQQQTRRYAKRQGVFWRWLRRRIDQLRPHDDKMGLMVKELNLTGGDQLNYTHALLREAGLVR